MKLSVIIPSYKDPLVQQTINSLLGNSELGDEIEIIVVFDGYWPIFSLQNDDRIIYLHLGKNRGMREAINAGVDISRGEFIMRTDEHCMFTKGYDKELTRRIKDSWIVTPIRYFLNPEKWELMDIKPVIYEKLKIQDLGDGLKKFMGVKWHSREKKRKHKMLDQTMAMQGSCWVMSRKWWDKVIGRLETENYGSMYQDSHEMVFKTWKAGGKLVVNKHTWFAHKHVSFPRTHQYSRRDWEFGVKYSYENWKDYYEEIKKKWRI